MSPMRNPVKEIDPHAGHPSKKRCPVCSELYCPADGCDPYHAEACREAVRA